MAPEVLLLPARLNDVLRTLKQLSGEGSIDWKELKIGPDRRAEHVHWVLVSKGNRWATMCDARAVAALLYYLCKRGYVNDASPDSWIINDKKTVQQNASFPEPTFVVQCNRLLGALRDAGHKVTDGDELRVVIGGSLHAHLVGLLIDQGEYWAEGYRFARGKDPNSIQQAFGQLVQRRLVRSEAAASGKDSTVLMVRSQGQF